MPPEPEARVRIVAKREGHGLLGARLFLPGEPILVAQGEIHDQPSRGSVQIGPDQHLAVPPGADRDAYAWRFLNHACRPNAAFDGQRLVALARIEPGEELTFDYETTEWELESPFVCACEAPDCGGRTIRGFRHLSHAERLRRLPQLRADLRRVLETDAAPPAS